MKRPNRKTDFVSDNGGNTAMIFGLSFIPVMFALGAATDYTRLTIARAELQQGTDSAALAVAQKVSRPSDTTTVAEAKTQAQVILNSRNRLASATVSEVTINPERNTVCATSQMTIPNAFMQLAKIGSLTTGVTSCANSAGSGDPDQTLEIALVLDNSGSMSSSAGGVSKIQALRSAATDFVNNMFTKVPKADKLKISITPFNAAVRAVDPAITSNRTASWVDTQGNSSIHWRALGGKAAANAAGFTNRFDIFNKLKARRSSWDWNGCFESQPYPMNVNDTPPTSSDSDTLLVPYLSPDEPDGYYSTSTGNYTGTSNNWNNFEYSNSYLTNDNGGSGGCASESSQWGRLTRVCKYNISSSTSSIDTGTMGPDGYCSGNSNQTLMRLTTTKSVITNKIGSLSAGGNTNLHEGVIWGWRTISPNAPFSDGMAYHAPKLRKVMVVMTDGENVWQNRRRTAGGSDFQALGYYSFNGTANVTLPNEATGSSTNFQTELAAAAPNNSSSNFGSQARNAIDELARQTCNNAKAAGIEVFTIGFSTPTDPIDQQGLNLLRDCATNPDHYFEASDATQLGDAFASVSAGLGKLRLSQ